MPRFKKGSAEAKAYMARIRGMRKKVKSNVRSYMSPVRHMARRSRIRRRPRYAYARRRGGKSIMRTLFKWFRVGAAVAPAAGIVMERGPSPEAVKGIVSIYTGYNMDTGQFQWDQLLRGWLPLIAVTAVTWGVGKVGGIFRKM
jgi:hypothetical protein